MKEKDSPIIVGVEENSRSELPNLPNLPNSEPLTINEVDADELLKAFLDARTVELPPWIIVDDNGRVKLSPQALHIHIEDNHHILAVKLGESRGLELYHYKDGYYQKWTESECKAFIKSFLPRMYRTPSQWEHVYKELTTQSVNTQESELNADESIINFRNCILGIDDVDQIKMLPHSPEYISTIQIPCNYNPNASIEQAPEFWKYIQDLSNGNEQDQITLLEIIGVVISNVIGARFKQLLILKGLGDTGKSVLREFVAYLIGAENSYTVDLKQLHSEFGLSGIYGKRLIGSGDMKFENLTEIDKIKELTGGDKIQINAKYKQQLQANYRGFCWFNCNDLPMFGGDRGIHVYNRFLIVSCDNVIPKNRRDANLLDKIKQESDVVASVAVNAMLKAKANDYTFTESEKTKANREAYAIKNNSLKLFLEQCFALNHGRTNVSEFNRKYNQWCKENRLRAENPHDISRILKEEHNIVPRKSNVLIYDLTVVW